MKGLIKYTLNHIPRPIMQRVAEFAVPLLGLAYLGRGRECPICGARRRKFLPYGYVTVRESALCPSCLSLERHRLLWLYLERETELFHKTPQLMHIAPEVCIMKHLRKQYRAQGESENYITADLESPLADMHFDVQSIPMEDNVVEVILCNHIMEHVADDLVAMRELYRIMKPGGWGIILSPVERDRAKTFEDDSITDPQERNRIFGQYDHRRIYGRDYSDRLRSAGFKVEEVDYIKHFSEADCHLYALTDEIIYIVRK